MFKNDLYRVWGLENAQTVIRANPDRRVIYFQDGKNNNPNEDVFGFLDSTYILIEKQFFPQTFRVGVYDPKPSK
jgi:hypothetical protein